MISVDRLINKLNDLNPNDKIEYIDAEGNIYLKNELHKYKEYESFFLIDERMYVLRSINPHNYCWLEPVLVRHGNYVVNGGLNKILHITELRNLQDVTNDEQYTNYIWRKYYNE